jgi:hypothetical protein
VRTESRRSVLRNRCPAAGQSLAGGS